MKKLLLLILMLSLGTASVYAKTDNGLKFNIRSSIFKNYSMSRGVDAREVKQIKELLSDLNKYSNSHDVKNLKELYSKNFLNTDGFDYNTFFTMIEETFRSYDNISYSTEVKNIKVIGDWAIVELTDTTKATLKKTEGEFTTADDGDLEGLCNYVLYLKKENDDWLIISDNILSEETSLKYGDAKNITIQLKSPLTVKKDSEYIIGLDMEYPKDAFVLVSLNTEEISYPPGEPNEVYRKLPSDGFLERIVRANKYGKNEYAVASVGITKLSLEANSIATIKFQMSGMAFVMKRVNVIKNTQNEFLKKAEEKVKI